MKRSFSEVHSDSDDDEQLVMSAEELAELRKDAEAYAGVRRNGGRSERLIQNNIPALLAKLDEMQLLDREGKPLEWAETLMVTTESSLKVQDLEDDLARETLIYNETLDNVLKALELCEQFGIKHQRPDDYYAEMLKTDDHMLKLKDHLLATKRRKEESNRKVKERQMKKYAKKVQTETRLRREKQKAEDMAVVKEWRKQKKRGGHDMDEDFPEHLLDPKNAERKNLLAKSGPIKVELKKSKRREGKDLKYGNGPKRSRKNTAASSADMSDFKGRSFGEKRSPFKSRPQTIGGNKKGSAGPRGGGKPPRAPVHKRR